MLMKFVTALSLICTVSAFASDYDIETLRGERAAAAHRQRRIIYNNDGNDKPGKVVTPETFLKNRTIGLESSQVDSVFYCTGVYNYYTHNSKVTEVYGEKQRTLNSYGGAKDWCQELIAQGTDSLEIMTKWCKDNHREILWSMRMNDTHDNGVPELFSEFKKKHPEYLMGKKGDFFPHGNYRWSALNYELAPVRDKTLEILTDVCSRYDIDGIELDFFRHPTFFIDTMQGGEASEAQCALMTDMIQKIRAMTETVGLNRKRPLLLAIRIPDSLGYCKALGLDVESWLEQGLTDVVSGGCYFRLEPWENLAAVGKKYNVAVYAVLEARRIVPAEHYVNTDGRVMFKTELLDYQNKAFRGEAYIALKAGVDGIYIFNRFNPKDPLFNELGDIKALEKMDRIDQSAYVQHIWSRPEVWLSTAYKYFKGEQSYDNPDTIVNENLTPYRHRAKFNYKRKIIYNNDGYENLLNVEITPQSFLDARTSGLEDTNISTIFYCTGLTTAFTHRTEAAGRFGYGGISDERKNFPVVLDKFDTDSLTLQIDYARKHHKEIFWSLRMNDTHDSSMKAGSLRTVWKEKHPECLMGAPGEKFPYGGSRWSALDYSKPLVRKFIFSVIEEVCNNYDIDGIELDFFRHPVYFKEVMLGNNASSQSLQYMTRLIEDIRRMTESVSTNRGRPLLIAIHIPDSLDYCKAIGLDARSWLEKELVDMVVGGGYFQLEPWENLAAIGKQYNVPVYPCFEARLIVPKAKMEDDDYIIKRFRAAALEAYEAGIGGVCTFNTWYAKNGKFAGLYNELGDAELLKTLDRIDEPAPITDWSFPPEVWLKGGSKFLKLNEPAK